MANYLYIAILVVCFYDALISGLLPSSVSFTMPVDGSSASMISITLAMLIGFYSLAVNSFKKIDNKWAIGLIFFIIFSSFHGPNIIFKSPYIPEDACIFNFKPMFEIMIYLFLFMGISNMNLNQVARQRIYNAMAWTGIIYSAYILLQWSGMDQIYKLTTSNLNILSRHPKCGGFIGQPVFAAAVLAMCFPFVVKYKPWGILILLLGMVGTGNRSGWVAIALSMAYFMKDGKLPAFRVLIAYMGIIALVIGIYIVHPNILNCIQSSGRLETWKVALSDIFHPTFPGLSRTYILSGLGIGSFSIFFPSYHHNPFYQAHNEYLEVLYGLSIIGFFLFIMMIRGIFKASKDICITASLLAISVFCMTNAGWHIPQLQFLTIFLCGLVYNVKEN